ncbi:penicillin-binding transpeptidase domain-containing protein [Streptomyces sp. NPDC020983]|uniref:penicillin-binding transpeptidase domain-containing protein n=1 Tax=Streptomyces sp. NPDC020983 TaxID=3365106 RepID=UPI0037967EBE
MPLAPGAKAGIVGTVLVVMLSVAGYGAYNIYSGLDGGGGSGGDSDRTVADTAAPVAPEDITRTAAAFLAAWSAGDVKKAAVLTDSMQTATAAMTSLAQDAKVSKVTATPQPLNGTTVPFTVKATVSYANLPPKEWDYSSRLTVDRNLSGEPVVKWTPDVLVPGVQANQSVVTRQASSPQLDLLDRHGDVMTAAAYPGLTDVFDDLRKRYDGSGGTPGIETYIADAQQNTVKTLLTVKPGKNARLQTTLDAGLQKAAEKAVASATQAGVTALDTRTGAILAMASNPPGGENYALALKAPGSTFKIVTATALMLAPHSKAYPHGIGPSSPARCVDGYNVVGGKQYHNVTRDNVNADLAWDFAQSCNTGFIRLSPNLDQPNGLSDVGRKYFGLAGDSQPWYVGTGTEDGSIPGGTGDEFTSEMIGQGQVLMNTLEMASVSATVVNGRFVQPSILEDKDLIDKRTAIHTTSLPGYVQQGLKQMMKQTADHGTASGLLNGVAHPYGAKTGSAEENEGQADGWFTAFAGHVAAAGVVVGGGHGNASAGPIVASVLKAAS